MMFSRSGSAPSQHRITTALSSHLSELSGDTVYSVAKGHDFEDAPESDESRQPWAVSSSSGLAIVIDEPQAQTPLELAFWRPWTDAVNARSVPEQGVIEITWIDGTTSGIVISDSSRRRRRGLALSIKEQIQGSITVSERHDIAGQEVLIAVRRSPLDGSFSQVIGGDSTLLDDPESADEINAIESKLRSMCGLAP